MDENTPVMLESTEQQAAVTDLSVAALTLVRKELTLLQALPAVPAVLVAKHLL